MPDWPQFPPDTRPLLERASEIAVAARARGMHAYAEIVDQLLSEFAGWQEDDYTIRKLCLDACGETRDDPNQPTEILVENTLLLLQRQVEKLTKELERERDL